MVHDDQFPPSIDYVLTEVGAQLIPALDILYIWSIRQMDARQLPIDADAFVVHKAEKYVDALRDIMDANGFWPDADQQRGAKLKRK